MNVVLMQHHQEWLTKRFYFSGPSKEIYTTTHPEGTLIANPVSWKKKLFIPHVGKVYHLCLAENNTLTWFLILDVLQGTYAIQLRTIQCYISVPFTTQWSFGTLHPFDLYIIRNTKLLSKILREIPVGFFVCFLTHQTTNNSSSKIPSSNVPSRMFQGPC